LVPLDGPIIGASRQPPIIFEAIACEAMSIVLTLPDLRASHQVKRVIVKNRLVIDGVSKGIKLPLVVIQHYNPTTWENRYFKLVIVIRVVIQFTIRISNCYAFHGSIA